MKPIPEKSRKYIADVMEECAVFIRDQTPYIDCPLGEACFYCGAITPTGNKPQHKIGCLYIRVQQLDEELAAIKNV